MPKISKKNNEPNYFWGIDPGKSGGIACLRSDHSVISLTPIPKTESQIVEVFESLLDKHGLPKMVTIEKVHSMPGNAARSMFTFGRGVGILIGILLAINIPHEEIPPQTWMKGLNIPKKKKGESKTTYKDRLKEEAIKRFPSVKSSITFKTCDALLMAEYGVRVYNG